MCMYKNIKLFLFQMCAVKKTASFSVLRRDVGVLEPAQPGRRVRCEGVAACPGMATADQQRHKHRHCLVPLCSSTRKACGYARTVL